MLNLYMFRIFFYRYYCLAAVAALLKYIEYIQRCVYAPGSLKIVYKALRDATLIGKSVY